ncbi:hypothetical protein SUGI_0984250 [Cryptomeria japonica]|uniref:ubiquitin carboxyl-terminal hydrolase 23 n=1 Tax=Cryptomeria japonica TaxID=3369 RepID=UPI0024148CC0|nr:ubiquitin carboxyl-terminal hydrolase 23 [Cryptomeria japonica]GLJ46688.1 hypothetical protein SUGI_0984250 [Cryptomeria japonica]
MLYNCEENTRGFERETTNFMDVDDDDEDEGTALVEFSPSSTPEFSPISRWNIPDFWNPNIGAGLRNMGNTCYMNSVLQCITYTVPLVEALRNCDHKIPCTIGGFCALCALRDIVELSLSSQGEVVEPTVLFENLGNMSSSFQKWQQEDAHDYLHSLLEDLDNCALGTGHFNPCSFFQGSSFVKKIFGGCLRSQVKCTHCCHCSNAFEPFIDLSLEIDEADSLTSALQSFTRVESIVPDFKYRCDNCHQNAPILKQFTISQPSDVLVIQLKRFANNGLFGCFGDKVQKMVAYPQVLDMEPFFSNPQQEKVEMKYELYAVLVHAGFSLNSGHYYCFVRSGYDEWYEMDDSQVIRATEGTVMRQQAYILFYFRKGSHWFSDSLNSKVKDESDFFGSPKSVLEETITSEESSRELSEADGSGTDCSDGIYSSVNPEMLSNGTTINGDTRLNNSHCSLNVDMRNSAVPVSSYMSNVESTSLKDTSEACTAHTFLGKPEPLRYCSEEKETNSGQDSGETKFSCLSVDTKSTRTSDIQVSGKKRLSPATSYLSRKKNKRWMGLGNGKFCYGAVSSLGRRGRAKSISPSCKARKSIIANFQKNAPEKTTFLDSDPVISEQKDQSTSI